MRDYGSNISEEENYNKFKCTGFNTDKCPLEYWTDAMIELCEEEIKKDMIKMKKKRSKKKKKKLRNKPVNTTVESKITLKKELIPNTPFSFANVGLETAATSMTKWQIVPYTFLADSGASSHMGHCESGMLDFQAKCCGIKIGDGQTMTVNKIG